MVNPVTIELNVEDVKKKTLEEKVDVLVDIAFANHTLLADHGLIIFGNGNPEKGLCFKVNTQGTRLNWLIGILSALGLTGLAGFVSYLAGK
jgi:hypothetical protein